MRYFDIRNDIFLSFYEEFECESYLFMIDFRIFFVPLHRHSRFNVALLQHLSWVFS